MISFGSYVFYVELEAIVQIINLNHQKRWNKLWLEGDSCFKSLSFLSSDLVPWKLCNKWCNYLNLVFFIEFKVFYIYREENTYLDNLTYFSVSSKCFT